MNKPITYGTLRAQALRCESAKHEKCKCRCGGALHGKAHAHAWIEFEVERDRVAHHRAPGQVDWVGYAGYEAYL
jgi:hypothetical protein